MIRGIHHVALHTRNFDRIAKFYQEAFGFEPVRWRDSGESEYRWDNFRPLEEAIGIEKSSARALMFKAGNCYLELFEYFAPPPRDGGPARPFDHGYTHFAVDVTDIEQEYDRLGALGMTFASPKLAEMGSAKFVYGKDPDGNIIELQQVGADHPFALDQLECIDF
jgi:glyoxylase I family protein